MGKRKTTSIAASLKKTQITRNRTRQHELQQHSSISGSTVDTTSSVKDLIERHRASNVDRAFDGTAVLTDALTGLTLAGDIPSHIVAHGLYQRAAIERTRPQPAVTGPPPPPAWRIRNPIFTHSFGPITIKHTFADHALISHSPPHSLLFLSAKTVAVNLERYSGRMISNLNSTIKETILSCRALTVTVAELKCQQLKPSQLQSFFDPELRYCDFSHSRIDLKTLRVFLPNARRGAARKILKDYAAVVEEMEYTEVDITLNDGDSPDALESWEDLFEEPAPYANGLHKMPELKPPPPLASGCHYLHSLSLAFTDLPAAPLARLLVSTSLSNNLTHLNLSGCFNATSGPAVLDILSRGLFRLVQLDLSHCDWASEDAIMSMSWDSVGVICFPFLEVLVMRECPVVERPMGAKFREVSRRILVVTT